MAIMCPEMPNVRYPVFLTPNDVYEIEFSEHGFLNRALTHTVYKANSIKQSPFDYTCQ
jgi:hypothetical protein